MSANQSNQGQNKSQQGSKRSKMELVRFFLAFYFISISMSYSFLFWGAPRLCNFHNLGGPTSH